MNRLSPALFLSALLAACSPPPAGLARPNAAMLDDAGNLLVADFHHDRVVTFDPQGQVAATWGQEGFGPDRLWQVRSLAPDPAGRGFWVINLQISGHNDGTAVWEAKRVEGGHEREVHTIAPAGPSGTQWIGGALPLPLPEGGWLAADSDPNLLVDYDPAWKVRRSFSAPVADEAGPAEPFAGLSSLRRVGDDLWLVEQDGHRVRRLDSELHQRAIFGEEGDAEGQLRYPQDLAVCPGHWVAVADLGNYRVQRFDLDGRYLDGFEPDPAGPDQPVQLLAILTTPACDRLYLVDSKGDRVLVTTPQGEVLATLTGAGN